MIPQDLSPEIIEAIDPSLTLTIANFATDLHDATVGVFDMLSAKDVEEQENLRSSMKIKLAEGMNHLSKKIADLQAIKKDLDVLRDRTSNDKTRIESHKIGLYVKEKELRNQGRPNPS